MKKVAVGIIENTEGLILGVSRKYDHTIIGLIGGKCDGDEEPYDALVRETKEETGLTVLDAILLDVREYDGWLTYAYIITEYTGTLMSNEELINKGEGICKFAQRSEFNFCALYNEQRFINYDKWLKSVFKYVGL